MLAYELEKSGLAHLLKSFLKNSVEISFISGNNCSLKNIFYTLKANVLLVVVSGLITIPIPSIGLFLPLVIVNN